MRKIFTIFIIVLILAVSAGALFYLKWPKPSTPEGTNPYPIFNTDFQNPVIISVEKIPSSISGIRMIKEKNYNRISIKLPKYGDIDKYEYDVFKGADIIEFNSNKEATDEYIKYKETFTDESEYWKLYKEEGNSTNKFFIAYKTTEIYYNHLIPSGIRTSPEIIIVYLKNNIFVTVSYTGYKNYNNYIKEINIDIVYVSDILKHVIENKN